MQGIDTILIKVKPNFEDAFDLDRFLAGGLLNINKTSHLQSCKTT